jgi:hypothetical protein
MYAGLLDAEATLLHCTDGSSDEQQQQLSLSTLVDLLPPATEGDSASAEQISEASWSDAVQQLHAAAGGRGLSTQQQVRGVQPVPAGLRWLTDACQCFANSAAPISTVVIKCCEKQTCALNA